MPDTITITLTRPVRSVDRELTELVMREPTGRDLAESGFPTRVREGGAIEIDPVAVNKLGARLCGVGRPTIESLRMADWNAVMTAILGFLGDTAATSSTDILMSPDTTGT